jgi:CheY-like chemotaxis protein/MinD-like ATPase involved in chromosome partitioning or flagellar assembly
MAPKILIVDDDVDTLRMVGIMLERQGYEILAASGGVQGLAMAKAEKPDMILLDLMMPDIDGTEVTRQLRADPQTQNILIIMFTAKSQVDDKIDGFDAGADDYLTKPAQPKELVAHVRALLTRAQRSVSVATPARLLGARGKLVGVIAAKGGVGVTTIAVNLGIALIMKHRKSVILADFRPGAGTLGLETGLPSVPGINQLLQMQPSEITAQSVEAALVSHPSNARFLLSSPEPQDARFLTYVDHHVAIANYVAHLSPVTVLDLGSLVTPINEKILPSCNEVVVVLEPVAQTILQTRLLIDYLNKIGIGDDQITSVLVNRVRAGVQLALGQVQDHLERKVDVIFTAAPDIVNQAQLANTPMLLVKQAENVTIQQIFQLGERIARRL